MAESLLVVEGLRKQFGNIIAIDGIDFSIGRNEICGLIGPNGSGKTTTFNMISGFLAPTAGRILLDGRPVQGKQPHWLARNGIVRTFQLIQIYGDLTVEENVVAAHHLRRHGLDGAARMSASDVRENCNDLLQWLELTGFAETRAGDLPAGLQRTLSIANAMACKPRLLLLDEPLAGLNPTEKQLLADRIAMLPEQDTSVLLVEHDVKSVTKICNRVVVINFGRKIAEGEPMEITANPEVRKAYLGSSHD